MRRVPGGARTASLSGGIPEAWAIRCASVAPGGPTGSSHPTVPSSTATQRATAVSSLVTEAHGNRTWAGPALAATPRPPDTTPAAATVGQPGTAGRGAPPGP